MAQNFPLFEFPARLTAGTSVLILKFRAITFEICVYKMFCPGLFKKDYFLNQFYF